LREEREDDERNRVQVAKGGRKRVSRGKKSGREKRGKGERRDWGGLSREV